MPSIDLGLLVLLCRVLAIVLAMWSYYCSVVLFLFVVIAVVLVACYGYRSLFSVSVANRVIGRCSLFLYVLRVPVLDCCSCVVCLFLFKGLVLVLC